MRSSVRLSALRLLPRRGGGGGGARRRAGAGRRSALLLSALALALLPAPAAVGSDAAPQPQRQPIYHWWPTTGQSQDPSGVLQTADGRWHVFPDCAGPPYNFTLPYTSGLMWCHFSSSDLVHWDEHPPALAPNTDVTSSDVFTGSIVALPNGSHWAIFATVNRSSHNASTPRGTYQFCTGNIAAAVSHDPLLERWEQTGTVIDNVMGTPAAPPGLGANYCTLQDPTTPWLGACSPPSRAGERCWNVVLGSGNNNASSPNFGNLGLLYRTRSADDLRRWDYVGVLFKSAHTPYFRPGYLFSCPDFFRLANTTVRCSLLSICSCSLADPASSPVGLRRVGESVRQLLVRLLQRESGRLHP